MGAVSDPATQADARFHRRHRKRVLRVLRDLRRAVRGADAAVYAVHCNSLPQLKPPTQSTARPPPWRTRSSGKTLVYNYRLVNIDPRDISKQRVMRIAVRDITPDAVRHGPPRQDVAGDSRAAILRTESPLAEPVTIS